MFSTIIQNSSNEIVEKKSRFIANLIYIESVEDAEIKIKEFKKKFHDARHNCFAYRVMQEDKNIYEKASDDGEPSGTAGQPMLNLLQKGNLCNILLIVTRYFGGILLGTGGLVRAYTEASQGAIDMAEKVTLDLGTEFEVEMEYSDFEKNKYYFSKNNIYITKTEYKNTIFCQIEMDNIVKNKFLEDIDNKKINILKIAVIREKYIEKR